MWCDHGRNSRSETAYAKGMSFPDSARWLSEPLADLGQRDARDLQRLSARRAACNDPYACRRNSEGGGHHPLHRDVGLPALCRGPHAHLQRIAQPAGEGVTG